MATRSNALSEITRFWLQDCYGLFIRESIPVKLIHNNSDIDFAVTSPGSSVTLLNRITFKNAIIETKDERDFDPHGTDFAKRLKYDFSLINDSSIDENVKCNFSMLKKQHHNIAEGIFDNNNFVKIFIFHNLNKKGIESIINTLCEKNIYFVTSDEVLKDIFKLLNNNRSGAGVRNSLVGDILDMLVTYHKIHM